MHNSFSELIKRRRSYRKYTEDSLSPEQVKTILQAGLMAPSSKSKTPWEFVVVEDKDSLEELSKCKQHGSSPIAVCSLAIVVIADTLISDVWIEDAAIASIMMQLQAEDLGLGSCWIQIRNRFTETDESSDSFIKDTLNIPMQYEVLSVITIGYKEKDRPNIDTDNLQWEKIHIDKF